MPPIMPPVVPPVMPCGPPGKFILFGLSCFPPRTGYAILVLRVGGGGCVVGRGERDLFGAMELLPRAGIVWGKSFDGALIGDKIRALVWVWVQVAARRVF